MSDTYQKTNLDIHAADECSSEKLPNLFAKKPFPKKLNLDLVDKQKGEAFHWHGEVALKRFERLYTQHVHTMKSIPNEASVGSVSAGSIKPDKTSSDKTPKSAAAQTQLSVSNNDAIIINDTEADKNIAASLVINIDLKQSQSGIYWLDFAAHGDIMLTCQRCLEPVQVVIQIDDMLALVVNEVYASALDDEDDYVLLQESDYYTSRDNLSNVTVGQLDVLGLIEDEILLSLPQSPKHQVCDAVLAYQLMSDDDGQSANVQDNSANPFAALASLKDKL